MPRRSAAAEPMTWPAQLDLDALPTYSDRDFLARLHTHYYGPVSRHTLASWPMDWILLNGRACCETRAFVAEAQRRFDTARRIRPRKQQAFCPA
ncbi:MAG: hypothetical protein ACJ8AI_20255 [Rhodopila sp.]|jgi:hypothetical protein